MKQIVPYTGLLPGNTDLNEIKISIKRNYIEFVSNNGGLTFSETDLNIIEYGYVKGTPDCYLFNATIEVHIVS